MSDWKHQFGLDDADIEEMIQAQKENFLRGVIDEDTFRRLLAKFGCNASEIEEIFGVFNDY